LRRDAYLFATFEALDVGHLAGYSWTTLEGKGVPLLPAEVWDEEPDAGAAS
jgi:hypothetical protein